MDSVYDPGIVLFNIHCGEMKIFTKTFLYNAHATFIYHNTKVNLYLRNCVELCAYRQIGMPECIPITCPHAYTYYIYDIHTCIQHIPYTYTLACSVNMPTTCLYHAHQPYHLPVCIPFTYTTHTTYMHKCVYNWRKSD